MDSFTYCVGNNDIFVLWLERLKILVYLWGNDCMLDFLQAEGVFADLIQEIENFKTKYGNSECKERIPEAHYKFYGTDIWNQACAALLCGQNILLVGQKATGKNLLAENLATVFQRPLWNISCHINMDAETLIGSDTFKNGVVEFRPGPVYRSATEGGFCVIDEINMAKNETLAVLHSLLDFRRIIYVPGYGSVTMHGASRFIATMNYGYAGTRELNEALGSRFVVITMPEISKENILRLLEEQFPRMGKNYRKEFAEVFTALQRKCSNAEISGRLLDLRGLLDALRLMEKGISPLVALDMGITNKSFEEFERQLVRDVFRSRISEKLTAAEIFR